MDTLSHIISFFAKVAFALFLFIFIWWITALVFPKMSLKSMIASSNFGTSTPRALHATTTDFLPSPRTYSAAFKRAPTPTATTNLYVAPAPFDGYNLSGGNPKDSRYTYSTYNYITYDATGKPVAKNNSHEEDSGTGKVSSPSTSSQGSANSLVNNSLYVRNLSIYKGGHMYTGLSFVGEARASLFRDGKFPIVIVDQNGRVVGISAAVAETVWAVPGWVRFSTKINYILPNNVPCTMLFEEALTQTEKTRQPLRINLPVVCN